VSTNYNTLNYSQQAIITIDLSIQMDNAVQIGATAGLGTPNFVQTRSTNVTGGGGQIG
jgi:hypothetical protein